MCSNGNEIQGQGLGDRPLDPAVSRLRWRSRMTLIGAWYAVGASCIGNLIRFVDQKHRIRPDRDGGHCAAGMRSNLERRFHSVGSPNDCTVMADGKRLRDAPFEDAMSARSIIEWMIIDGQVLRIQRNLDVIALVQRTEPLFSCRLEWKKARLDLTDIHLELIPGNADDRSLDDAMLREQTLPNIFTVMAFR